MKCEIHQVKKELVWKTCKCSEFQLRRTSLPCAPCKRCSELMNQNDHIKAFLIGSELSFIKILCVLKDPTEHPIPMLELFVVRC